MYTYEQSTGRLFDANMSVIATGYAGGNCGKNPEGVNNPAFEETPCVGPLPVGFYNAGAVEDSPNLGPYAIALIPNPSNIMFGRSGFFMHGDTSAMDHSASEGCIIMPRTIREQFYTSADNSLEVVHTVPI